MGHLSSRAELTVDLSRPVSCKGRGVCPSCNARRMVEVAAHLSDHVLPPRQWMPSLPKRIRPFLWRPPTTRASPAPEAQPRPSTADRRLQRATRPDLPCPDCRQSPARRSSFSSGALPRSASNTPDRFPSRMQSRRGADDGV